MKKRNKICIITIFLIFMAVLFNNVNASDNLSLELQTNTTKYSVGDEIKLKIKLNEKVMAASYYLNYNSSVVEYKKTSDETSNLATKDYPDDNTLRAVFSDNSGEGTDEIIVTFKVKSESTKDVAFYLTNATFTSATVNANGKKESYSDNQISGIQNKATIQIESRKNDNPSSGSTQKPGNDNPSSDKTGNMQATGRLPQTGGTQLIIYILIIGFTVVAIFFRYHFIKLEKYFK